MAKKHGKHPSDASDYSADILPYVKKMAADYVRVQHAGLVPRDVTDALDGLVEAASGLSAVLRKGDEKVYHTAATLAYAAALDVVRKTTGQGSLYSVLLQLAKRSAKIAGLDEDDLEGGPGRKGHGPDDHSGPSGGHPPADRGGSHPEGPHPGYQGPSYGPQGRPHDQGTGFYQNNRLRGLFEDPHDSH